MPEQTGSRHRSSAKVPQFQVPASTAIRYISCALKRSHPYGPTRVRGHAMKMNRTGMRVGVTVLALGASVLPIPTSQAQRAAGLSRVGWLEVCGPGPRRPHFDIFRGRLAELGYVEGKNLVIEHGSFGSGADIGSGSGPT